MMFTRYSQLKVGRAYTDNTSVLGVPLIFWGTGALGILVGLLRLARESAHIVAGQVGSGAVIAVVHLFTLAGFTMVMMGALYQLNPVLLNCDPVPARRAWFQWALYVAGVSGFVEGMAANQLGWIVAGGVGLVLGIGAFLTNIAGRLRRRTTWNITMLYLTSGEFYLALVVIWGALLVWGYVGGPDMDAQIPVHMTLALGGWLGFVVTGASLRLWAMFGLRHREPRYWLAVWLSGNAAILVLILGHLAQSSAVVWVGWLLQLGAAGGYIADVIQAGLFDRKLVKQPALLTAVPATAFLVIFEGLGTVAVVTGDSSWWIAALLAYGLGWVGLNFITFSQKLVPFLVWLHRYAHVHNRGKMPRLNDIWRPWWAYPLGVLATVGVFGVVLGVLLGVSRVITWGAGIEALAWLGLIIAGARAVAGPHRFPD
jgi:hypothetical protein